MFSTRKLVTGKQPASGPNSARQGKEARPLTATRLQLCARGLRSSGGGRTARIDRGTQNSFCLARLNAESPAFSGSFPPKSHAVAPVSARTHIADEEERRPRQPATIVISPLPLMARLADETVPRAATGDFGKMQLEAKVLSAEPDTAQPEMRRLNEPEKLTVGESQFQEFVRKMYLVECRRSNEYESARPRQTRKLLKSISSAVDLHPRYQVTPWNIANSKLEKKKEDSEATVSEPKALDENSKARTHGMYRPVPLLSSEGLMRRVQAKNIYSEKIKAILSPRDQTLFEVMEECRLELLRRTEWFSSPEAQKNVYAMLTDLEEKWLEPSQAEYLKVLAEERKRVDQELRLRAATEAEKYCAWKEIGIERRRWSARLTRRCLRRSLTGSMRHEGYFALEHERIASCDGL